MEKYGLIGKNLSHSMSPFIHKSLFALSCRDASYSIFDVDSMSDFLLENTDITGYSITIPYKEEGYRLASSLHESAVPYFAINCVDSKGVGYNTDVDGFRMSISSLIESFDVKVLLLGFGGVGKMIAKQFDASKLTIAIRNITSKKLEDIYRLVGAKVSVVDLENIPVDEYALIVNATPIGMYPNAKKSPVSMELISKCGAVYDTVYNPLETMLIKQSEECGVSVKGGIDMLVYQAMVAHKYWYGAEFDMLDIDKIIVAVKDILNQKEWL